MTGEKDAYRAMVDRVNSMRDDGSIPGEPKGKPSTIDSPFNACCHRGQCKSLEARALAAEAALAAERGFIKAANDMIVKFDLINVARGLTHHDEAANEIQTVLEKVQMARAAALRAQGE